MEENLDRILRMVRAHQDHISILDDTLSDVLDELENHDRRLKKQSDIIKGLLRTEGAEAVEDREEAVEDTEEDGPQEHDADELEQMSLLDELNSIEFPDIPENTTQLLQGAPPNWVSTRPQRRNLGNDWGTVANPEGQSEDQRIPIEKYFGGGKRKKRKKSKKKKSKKRK